ncbi:MAG TPA: FG-GAP-like repeat-containing protein [Planctomycetota bacterium]|nr:FG-GAP-like repeat-containing protein [Planctomycetota bacterium]
MRTTRVVASALAASFPFLLAGTAHAQADLASVASHGKISSLAGLVDGFDGHDLFGSSLAALGDLDGDGVSDLAAGAPGDDDGGLKSGAVRILFLRPDGTVHGEQKLGAGSGGFGGALDGLDQFGAAVAPLGDLDGDGVTDLAVGAPGDGEGGDFGTSQVGAVWIAFLRPDGTVKGQQKLSALHGGLDGLLGNFSRFGAALAPLGDLDGDAVADLAVGGTDTVYILFLHADGTVKAHHTITLAQTGFASFVDGFGLSLARLGDLDGDGLTELAAGAPGASVSGAVAVLFLEADGSVKAQQNISATAGGLQGPLHPFDRFGASLAALGDADGDGVADLAAGAVDDDDGASGAGAAWILFLHADATVKTAQKLSATAGNFGGALDAADAFATSLAAPGDLDGDGSLDLVSGATGDDDGDTDAGALWTIFLDSRGVAKAQAKIAPPALGPENTLDDDDQFGNAAVVIGDLDDNGVQDLVVGAVGDDDGGPQRGAVWVLLMQADGNVLAHRKISSVTGGFTESLVNGAHFGSGIAALGDLDGDGVQDIAVGGWGDKGKNGFLLAGSVWVLFLNADGSVKAQQKINETSGGFTGSFGSSEAFGISVANIGDLDGDGVIDLVVGARGDEDGALQSGAAWILFLRPDGTVKAHQKISALAGGFTGTLGDHAWFGFSVAALGDLDGDGARDIVVGAKLQSAAWVLLLRPDGTVKSHVKLDAGSVGLPPGDALGGASLTQVPDLDGDGRPELAVGADLDNATGTARGAVWILSLDADGAAQSFLKIGDGLAGFAGALDDSDQFGVAVAAFDDLDGDGKPDLAVGAIGDDDGGTNHGALWLLHLQSGPWESAGTALAGVAGLPRLVGTGQLVAGSHVALSLDRAAPLAPAVVLFSIGSMPVPFKGGTLVPSPQSRPVLFFTDGAGALVVQAMWPAAVPPGFDLYAQAVVKDGAAVQGIALSNALKATTP